MRPWRLHIPPRGRMPPPLGGDRGQTGRRTTVTSSSRLTCRHAAGPRRGGDRRAPGPAMIVAVVVVVVLIAAVLIALGMNQPGQSSASLEWDPQERAEWMGGQES